MAMFLAMALVWAPTQAQPTTQPAVDAATPPSPTPAEPKNLGEAADQVGEAIEAAKGGDWWYFSALVIMIVMFALKGFKVLAKLGRVKYVIVPALSLGAALLAAFKGGVSVEAAVGVFTSSWATGMLEELMNHGILGKPHGES
jgi:hypothetical protein